MADRCEHCVARLDGVTPHAEGCPSRNEEIREKAESVQAQNDGMKELLQKYSDRCPCRPGAPCDLCDEASQYL